MYGLQTRIYSLEHKPRTLRATQETLDKLYEGAAIGLRKESLAYYAGMTMPEFRQLEQIDVRVAEAVIAGKADAEQELAGILMDAARNGDAKTALEILKHKHDWVAAQVVKNEHTGSNGGPIAMAAVDFRNLSNDELQTMKQMLEKSAGGSPE